MHEIFRTPDVPFPRREDLPVLLAGKFDELTTPDQSKWPVGERAASQMIQYNCRLWLFWQEMMEDFTYIGSSWGASKAVRKLAGQIAYREELSPAAEIYAVVELGVGQTNHKKYGVILDPAFNVAGVGRPRPEARAEGGESGPALDDEIKF